MAQMPSQVAGDRRRSQHRKREQCLEGRYVVVQHLRGRLNSLESRLASKYDPSHKQEARGLTSARFFFLPQFASLAALNAVAADLESGNHDVKLAVPLDLPFDTVE